MAIKIITGVPGSGKTFYSVKFLVENFYNYDSKSQKYNKKENVTVITNIESLHLEHLYLDDILKKSNKDVKSFFSLEYQKKIHEKYKKIVYFIDEAQFFFDRRFYHKEVFQYFQYHRHLGDDIILCTQDMYLLPAAISSLVETELRAVKRTLSFFGEFKYNLLSNKEIIDRKVLKPSKKIFDLYKSAETEEHLKIKNPFKKYLVAIIFLIIISIYFFYNTFILRSNREYSKNTEEKQTVVQTIKKDSIGNLSKKNKPIIPAQKINYVNQDLSHESQILDDIYKSLIPIELQYIASGRNISVMHPITKKMTPIMLLPFHCRLVKNRSLKVYAYVSASVYDLILKSSKNFVSENLSNDSKI